MKEIKFRAWDGEKMLPPEDITQAPEHRKWLGKHDYSLMQYTGLKDRNGKEIYEGDVIKGFGESGNFTVEYSDAKYIVTHKYGIWGNLCSLPIMYKDYGYKLEIIGNIYESTELIK